MNKNVILKSYTVREDIWNKILEKYSYAVKVVDNFDEYLGGYEDTDTIIMNTYRDQLICDEVTLDMFCNNILEPKYWRQVRLWKNNELDTEIDDTPSGTYCWNQVYKKILLKEYTEKEINDCLQAHRAPKNDNLIQFHYDWQNESQKVQKLTNTYKYDINGAHLAALIEIFPKCKDRFIKLYNKRKENKIYKKIPNYFVGMLKRRGFEETYNYIVQRTTKILFNAISNAGGILVYSNTDSLVVKDPENKLIASKELGEFKLEYAGDTYIYTDRNYMIYKFGPDLKGSCLVSVRNLFDLEHGQVVHYDNVVDNNLRTRTAANIKIENVGVELWQ